MLQKPDVNVSKIMELADFIDGLDSTQFSMKSFGSYLEPRCICGWLLHNECHVDKSDINLAAGILGINYEIARDLFGASPEYTPHEAASVLRHIAVTGELP
jgi:hypothetical protein